jgi:hypothetical protein
MSYRAFQGVEPSGGPHNRGSSSTYSASQRSHHQVVFDKLVSQYASIFKSLWESLEVVDEVKDRVSIPNIHGLESILESKQGQHQRRMMKFENPMNLQIYKRTPLFASFMATTENGLKALPRWAAFVQIVDYSWNMNIQCDYLTLGNGKCIVPSTSEYYWKLQQTVNELEEAALNIVSDLYSVKGNIERALTHYSSPGNPWVEGILDLLKRGCSLQEIRGQMIEINNEALDHLMTQPPSQEFPKPVFNIGQMNSDGWFDLKVKAKY